MDNSFVLNMKKNSRWYLRMSCVYGFLFTVCLYKNLSGITFPVITAVTLLFGAAFLNKAGIILKKDSAFYCLGILLLGISTCLTANAFFHLFNSAGIILLLMALMIHQIYEEESWSFTLYIKNFFILTGSWISSVPAPFTDRKKKREENRIWDNAERKDQEKKRWIKNKNAGAAVLGIVIALLFLMIVFPLLLMSDRVFSGIFVNLFQFINIRMIFEKIDVENFAGVIFTFFFGMTALYAFFHGMFRKNLCIHEKTENMKVSAVTGITFTSVLALIYVIYSGVQIIALFLRVGNVLPEGMTYSEYAHEGFWQLLLVSIINFAAVLICVKVFESNRIFQIMLCIISVCTCIMILSAAYRMMIYVSEYNLTFLRVLVLWFLGVLMLIFFGVILSIFRKDFRLFRYIMAVVSVCYILFSFSHTDALIASYNVENTENLGTEDVYYLMYGLSEDAVPVVAALDREIFRNSDMGEEIQYYFESFSRKNSGIRSWNYGRWRAKQAAEEWMKK